MLLDSYQGKILVSQPKCDAHFFKESCVLIAKHSQQGAWGVTLNKPIKNMDCDLKDVLEHIGMENPMNINAPLYAGGPVEKSRVCLLHSNDWSSSSTIEITKDVSITTDISVLAALVQGQGPSKFKIFCGLSTWVNGQLEGEMKGAEPWSPQHRWLTDPVSEHNVFDIDDNSLWPSLLSEAVTLEVKEWF